jgi:hypothetical protein
MFCCELVFRKSLIVNRNWFGVVKKVTVDVALESLQVAPSGASTGTATRFVNALHIIQLLGSQTVQQRGIQTLLQSSYNRGSFCR